MTTPRYPENSTTRLGRLPKRGKYDYATVHTIINTSPILHVSFTDPTQPFPVVLPMLGCTGNFANPTGEPNTTAQDIYIHGYVSGRIFKSGKSAGEEGLPITIAASHIDGLVLALAPFHNSCNYRSAVAYGYATLVVDEDERLYAMQCITDNLIPGRWDKSRNPPTAAELNSTSILRVKIASASAKVRTGGPHDDRADLKNEALRGDVWTGVVPVWLQRGEPIPGKENGYGKEGEAEEYIERWRVGENTKGRLGAYEAIQKDD